MISFLYEETAFGKLSLWDSRRIAFVVADKASKLNNKNPITLGRNYLIKELDPGGCLIPFTDEIIVCRGGEYFDIPREES